MDYQHNPIPSIISQQHNIPQLYQIQIMERMYHTTGSPKKQEHPKYSEIYYQKFKEMTSKPQSTHDHQSSTSVELSDSTYTFEPRMRTNTEQIVISKIETPNKMERGKQSEQMKQEMRPGSRDQSYRSQESLEVQRNRLILIRELGEIIGVPGISLNDLKVRMRVMCEENERVRAGSGENSVNEELQRSSTSMNSEMVSRRQSEAERMINSKNQIMSLAVKNLNEHVEKHRRETEDIFDRLGMIGRESVETGIEIGGGRGDVEGVMVRIDKIRSRVSELETRLREEQQISISKSNKIEELEASIAKLQSEIEGFRLEMQIVRRQRIECQKHLHQLLILRENEEKYKEKIGSERQINRSNRVSDEPPLGTPTFKQNIQDPSIILLRQKEEQNRLLVQTVQQLSLRLETQMADRLKSSVTSSISNAELKSYCKALETEIEQLKRYKEGVDRSIQNSISQSRISEQSKCPPQSMQPELKTRFQQVSSLNNKLIEDNSLLRTKIDQIELEKETSKIDQLNSVMTDMSVLKKDLIMKSEELETALQILESKQEEVDLYNKLIDEKNIEIESLKNKLEKYSEPSDSILKKQMVTLQESLRQSLETHERHVSLTTQQIQTLKEIGMNLERQNSQLLQMIKQYEQEIAKLVSNGNIPKRPQSLKSSQESQRFNIRASEIKKQLDYIVASIQNHKAIIQKEIKEEDAKLNRKPSENAFRNPFDVSKSNSTINYTPIINLNHNQEVIHIQPQTLLYQEHQNYYTTITNPPNNPVHSNAIHPNHFSHPNHSQIVQNKIGQDIPKYHQLLKHKASPQHQSKVNASPILPHHLPHKSTHGISPAKASPNSSLSKIVMMDRRNSSSKQRVGKVKESPYLTSPTFSSKSQIDYTKIQSLASKASLPSPSLQRVTYPNPPSTITIQRSPPPLYRNSPYFTQSKSMASIAQIQMQSSSKLSIKLDSKNQVSKPTTSPKSIYNIQGYSNSNSKEQAVMANHERQKLLGKEQKEPGIQVFQMDHLPKSDCC